MKKLLILGAFTVLLTSCYEEQELPVSGEDFFALSVSPEMQDLLNNSKDTAYILDGPVKLEYNGQVLALREIRIRGETALDFRRKSFGLKLDRPIFLETKDGSGVKKLSRFKLIALAMDYTYINNRLAFAILEDQGLMPLFYKYVGLSLNGEDQGVYFLVEDPERFYKEADAEFIMRRGYHNGIVDMDFESLGHNLSPENYVSRFREIYAKLPELHGVALMDHLEARLDLDQYCRKMAVDYFLKNGDYTDELYLYAGLESRGIRYHCIAWDYDDIFCSLPHEVGRAWATGKVFGSREYPSHQDVLDVVGDKLIFSIEDDLDYVIARDSMLYARYEKNLSAMMDRIDAAYLERIFSQIEAELWPFYENEAVTVMSQYDLRSTSIEAWQQNMEEKKAYLVNRAMQIKHEIRN